MPKISLIVPVYGVEQYLNQCVDSILQQSFSDLELILVDDCTKDNSGAICDEYAQKDPRVKVLHKPQNEGLGYARRDGLALASGEWILFVDSDDWLAPETLTVLSENLSEKLDILVFGFTLCYENMMGETVRKEAVSPTAKKAFTKQEIGNLLVALDTERCFPYMCNKLYRASFLKNSGVAFNIIKSMEDFFYNIEIFSLAKGISVISYPFYHYRKPAKETLVSAYNAEFFDLCKKRNCLEMEYLQQMDAVSEKNIQQLDFIHLKHLVSCMVRNTAENSPLSRKEQQQQAKEILRDSHTRAMLRHIRVNGLQHRIILLIFKWKLAFAAVWIGKLINRMRVKSIKKSAKSSC